MVPQMAPSIRNLLAALRVDHSIPNRDSRKSKLSSLTCCTVEVQMMAMDRIPMGDGVLPPPSRPLGRRLPVLLLVFNFFPYHCRQSVFVFIPLICSSGDVFRQVMDRFVIPNPPVPPPPSAPTIELRSQTHRVSRVRRWRVLALI